MKQNISPVGLKGNEINERILSLMGAQPIRENHSHSVIELTKFGPDGNVYAIIRENHKYFIKTTAKKHNVVSEDFSYIGGLQNKTSECYESYAKAIKHLNLKFNSLAEALGTSANTNLFESDTNMINAPEETPIEEEAEEGDEVIDEEIDLSKEDKDIEEMIQKDKGTFDDGTFKANVTEGKKLSIARLINNMDDIIDDLTKKKSYTIL
jgi:hypothetical protein